MSPETLRNWVRRDEIERGERDGLTIAEHAEIRELRRQVRRLEEEQDPLQRLAIRQPLRAGIAKAPLLFRQQRLDLVGDDPRRSGH